MIPELIELDNCPWKVLPKGVHQASLEEIEQLFANNPHRRELFAGFKRALKSLKLAGCRMVYLDGSFVTEKPKPNDYDACWDTSGVDEAFLDPVFNDFYDAQVNQKNKFGGEFFLVDQKTSIGLVHLEFFQKERFSGLDKGILSIDLTNESLSDKGTLT